MEKIKKVKFHRLKQVLSYVTGFSLLGISVKTPDLTKERDTADAVVSFMENRRVIFGPSERETYAYAVASAGQIRDYLQEKLEFVGRKSTLGQRLVSMQAAGQNYMTVMERPDLPEEAKAQALEDYQQLMAEDIARIGATFDVDVAEKILLKLPGVGEELEKDPDATYEADVPPPVPVA